MNRDDIVSKNVLNLIMLLDNSTSMENGRISQLNNSIPVLKRNLKKFAEKNNVELRVRMIKFNTNAEFIVGKKEEGELIEDVVWKDLGVQGATSTPKALKLANDSLRFKYLGEHPEHALSPVVILITDGFCNPDEKGEYLNQINIMKSKLTRPGEKEKVIRIAIGVEGYDYNELVEFATQGQINDEEKPLVFEVQNASDLANVINWVTVASLVSSMAATENDEVVKLEDSEWVDTQLDQLIDDSSEI